MAFTETVNFYLKTDNNFYIKYELTTTLIPTLENLTFAVQELIKTSENDRPELTGSRTIKYKHRLPNKMYVTYTHHEIYGFKCKSLSELMKGEKKELLKEIGCEAIEVISEEEYNEAVK